MSGVNRGQRSDEELIGATLVRKSRKEHSFPEFEEFLHRHESMARSVARLMLHNPFLVEQALQDAKLKMFQTGLKQQFTESPLAYYRTVVKRTCLDLFDYERRRRHESIDGSGEDGAPLAGQYAADPFSRPDVRLEEAHRKVYIERVLNEAFRRLLRKGPGKIRALDFLRMRIFEGIEVGEIARRTGFDKPNTVSQIIRRVIEELRKILEQMAIEGFPGVEQVFDWTGN